MKIVYLFIFTLLINLPFGYWRAGVRKLGCQWILAIHVPVLLIVLFRFVADVPFMWEWLPVSFVVFFAGQWLGGQLRKPKQAEP